MSLLVILAAVLPIFLLCVLALLIVRSVRSPQPLDPNDVGPHGAAPNDVGRHGAAPHGAAPHGAAPHGAAPHGAAPGDVGPGDVGPHGDSLGAGRDGAGPGRLRVLAWRWGGIGVGVPAAAVLLRAGALGRGLLLAAPVFALCVLGGTLLGELTGPAPSGTTRRAGLRVRRVHDYLPTALGWTVAAAAAGLFVLACATTAAGSTDDQGRAGRALSCVLDGGTASRGPWPGSYYTVPLLTLVVLGLVLAGVVLHRIVRRPQPAGWPDDALRCRSAEAVTAASGLLVLVPIFGISVTAAIGLGGMARTCGHPWWGPAGTALSILGGLAFLGTAWCLAVLVLSPARRPARTHP